MRMIFLVIIFVLTSGAATAAEVTAINTLSRGTVISRSDINILPEYNESVEDVLRQYVGMQTTRVVYAGHPLALSNLAPQTLVKRNKLVTLIYEKSGLSIATVGRAMDEGAHGDLVSVLNMSSKLRVQGVVTGPDQVSVQ